LERIFTRKRGFRVDIVSVFGNFQILMNPVSILLDNVPVKLVHCEFSDLPLGVDGSSPPCGDACNSHEAKVLIELGFIDFADPVSSHRYEVSAYSMSIKEEH
jgi:hypothetical protein